MTILTFQFLIVALLPLSFLLLLVYLWTKQGGRRPLRWAWAFTLLAGAIWSSSILRHYGGATFPVSLVFTWGIIGTYAFVIMIGGLLWTTIVHLSPFHKGRSGLLLPGILLLLVTLALDANIWRYTPFELNLLGQTIRQFDLWAALWITSWLISLLAVWLLTRQARYELPQSLYRNQIQYWVLVLNLFLIGGGLASIQQPRQPGWQQIGNVIISFAAFVGTVSLTNSQLTALPLATRQLLSRLSGTLVILGLMFGALWLASGLVANVPEGISPLIVLLLAAVLFTGLFTAVYQLVNELTRRLVFPASARRELYSVETGNALGRFPEPSEIARHLLRMIQSNLMTNEAWLFTAEDGVGGRLVLRLLDSLGNPRVETVDFSADSPFTTSLRTQKRPLAHYDILALPMFDPLPQAERELLIRWERTLYIPLHVGERLVGLVTLGSKHTGEVYDTEDFALLASLADQVAPLLHQALNVSTIRHLNDYVFEENQVLLRDKQYLQAVVGLYGQFMNLLSPDLRRPFATLGQELQKLQEKLSQLTSPPELQNLYEQIDLLKTAVDKLIVAAARLQNQQGFHFQRIQINDVVEQAMRSLRLMADARRVQVEFTALYIPKVYGDEHYLQEAVQHLLHNAIKFNRIDGTVKIELGLEDNDVFIRLRDEGVGMPAERLAHLWSGLNQADILPRADHDLQRQRLGLGLTLACFIITAHGGRITARSVYGTGSIFTIYLPLVFED